MSNLNKYVEYIKKKLDKIENVTEYDIVRFVYIDLGQRFSFDLNFAFGNSKNKKKIYKNSKFKSYLEKCMEVNEGICISFANILRYVLSELGINIKNEIVDEPGNKCPHVYNIITPKDGSKKYRIDLQKDIEYIQSHSTTKYFGSSANWWENKPVISRFKLEQIDKKIGYINENEYYSDEYLYLLKSDMCYFTNFQEKAQFVLENLEIYENKNKKYPERKWHHEKVLNKLFTRKELNKIHLIDCYKDTENGRKYKNCIVIDIPGGIDIYMFSAEENRYCKIDIKDFEKQIKNGLQHEQKKIPGLNQALKKYDMEK